MRRIHMEDAIAAARVLMFVPHDDRRELCRRMLEQAEAADKFVKRHGRFHPSWGNGSLLAAAHRQKMGPPSVLSDVVYCACLSDVLGVVLEHKFQRSQRS